MASTRTHHQRAVGLDTSLARMAPETQQAPRTLVGCVDVVALMSEMPRRVDPAETCAPDQNSLQKEWTWCINNSSAMRIRFPDRFQHRVASPLLRRSHL